VRIISRSRLRGFWASRRTTAEARTAEHYLSAWHKITQAAEWSNFGELRQTFGSADQVGNCVVFDVGNNRLRLIGRVFYETAERTGIVYVLKVMDHAEYDQGRWPGECGCHQGKPSRRGKKGGE
jgi:mRNA interferase HigB